MHHDIQQRLIRETLDALKELAEMPPEALQTRYSEFSALTNSLATMVKSPSLPSLCGPSVHFDEQGHAWV